MKSTVIKLKEKEYPFFRTIRSKVMFARSKFTVSDLLEGNMDAIVYTAYCVVLGACLRERVAFDMDYEEFVDNCPDNVLELFHEIDEQPETEGENPPSQKKMKPTK